MSHGKKHENDALLWANLSNDTSDDSNGENTMLDATKEKENGKGGVNETKKGERLKGKKNEAGEFSNHDIHKQTDGERGKKMRKTFSDPENMPPQIPSKASNDILTLQLESSLKKLKKLSQSLDFAPQPSNLLAQEPSTMPQTLGAVDQVSRINSTNAKTSNITTMLRSGSSQHPMIIQTTASSNVVLNICDNNDAQFIIYAPKKSGIFTNISGVLEKYKIEATSSNFSSSGDDHYVFMIQTGLENGAMDQFPEMTTVEAIYKQAVEEIISWIAA